MTMPLSNFYRRILLLIALVPVAIVMGIRLSVDTPSLVDKFLYDDSFYYFVPARRFVTSGLSSFDGLAFTNGYHPLWFLICSVIYFFFDLGSDLAIRICLVVEGLCSLGAIWILLSIGFEIAGPLISLLAFLVLYSIGIGDMINGLETGIAMLMLALVTKTLYRYRQERIGNWSTRQLGTIGNLLGLLFLSRTDQIFVVAFYSLMVCVALRTQIASHQGRRKFVAFFLPLAILCGGYLALNFTLTGHFSQVSGSAKAFHSEVARRSVLGPSATSRIEALKRNINWMWSDKRGRLVRYASILQLVALALLVMTSASKSMRHAREKFLVLLWPFFIGALCSVAYYHIVFFGGFTRTPWYYVQLFALSTLTLPLVFKQCVDWLPQAWRWLTPIAYVVVFTYSLWFLYHGLEVGTLISPSRFLWFIVISIPLAFFRKLNLLPFLAAVGLFAAPIISFYLREAKIKPWYWNYALYRGALWARENTPKNATIWSGSSGVLGYFSGRRVINADGLANSYQFLEQVLIPGRSAQYLKQYDYTIDAWGVPSGLEQAYPEGCEVKLPAELSAISFQDGAIQRRLTVYKLHKELPGECK